MKKTKLLFVIGICMCLLAGCKKENTTAEESTRAQNKLPCSQIIEKLLEQVTTTHNDKKLQYSDDAYEEYFDYLYDASIEKIADGAFAYASESYADEITVLRLQDSKDDSYLTKKLQARIESRKQDFNGYKPEEVEKLQNAVIDQSGDYIIMVVADDADAIIKAFQTIMSEEN